RCPRRADSDDAGLPRQIVQMRPHVVCSGFRAAQLRRANPAVAVHELVSVAPAIAKEIAVDLAVIAVDNPAQHSIPFADTDVASQTAMSADRRRKLLVPLAGVVLLERGICEDAGRTDFHEIAGKLVFENPLPLAAEVDQIAQCK